MSGKNFVLLAAVFAETLSEQNKKIWAEAQGTYVLCTLCVGSGRELVLQIASNAQINSPCFVCRHRCTLLFCAAGASSILSTTATGREIEQGYGREVPPVFTSWCSPVARVALYLTDKNKLGDLFGAAWLTIPLGVGGSYRNICAARNPMTAWNRGCHSRE